MPQIPAMADIKYYSKITTYLIQIGVYPWVQIGAYPLMPLTSSHLKLPNNAACTKKMIWSAVYQSVINRLL